MVAVDSRSLVPIAVETLGFGSPCVLNLYLRPTADGKPVLYRAKSLAMTPADVRVLLARNVRTLYIHAECLDEYEIYLREQVLSSGAATSDARYCALRDVNRAVLLDAMRHNHVGRMVDLAVEFGTELAGMFSSEEGLSAHLFGVLRHDYYTYTHVTNVCVYSLALAHALGVRGRDELTAIATGAILHDVGKRHIPATILNKRQKLTNDEIRVVQRHPRDGFVDLCDRADLSRSQLMMVYQHHEKLNGTGYPTRAVAAEIDDWAKICAVADVFDALTSHRPYRAPMPLADVLEHLDNGAGTAFDKEMIRCWMATVSHSTWTNN